MRCHRSILAPWHFSVLALLILLASCQGTPLGTALEEAVAPATPQRSERPLDPDDLDSDDLNTDDLNAGDRTFPDGSIDPDDLVDPEELPNLDDRLTPNDDTLGSSDSDSPAPESPDPSADTVDDATEGNESTDGTATDEDAVADSPSEPDGQNRFRDLDVDAQTAAAIAALDDLDVFGDIDTDDFQPNRSVRRQEFARWVTLANNALYADEPNRQLPLADDSETPLFLDVPEDRPEFPHIQALANAGIVEMRADREFEPDNLLSRADLIAIKVALDLEANSLAGTLADVERDWAFSDAADIRAGHIPAIASDFTLGDASNIRRIFGTLNSFDPQAPVTRAQVALALASFGVGDAQRSATAVDEPASAASETNLQPENLQPEDDRRPPSVKNPPQRNTPDVPESSENATTPGDRPNSAPPSSGDADSTGGRFLDL